MKRLLALAQVLVLYCILCSQTIGPNGQIYDRHCTVGDQFYTEAEAWFNDPDGDCLSTDYYIRYYGVDGNGQTYNNVIGGSPYDFGSNGTNPNPLGGSAGGPREGYWNCCPPGGSSYSGSSYGGGGSGTKIDNFQNVPDCQFYIDRQGIITIDCSKP